LILAQDSVAEDLAALLVEQAKDIRLGFPLEPSVQMGPLNNENTAEKMDRHVRDATERGARVLTGGTRLPQLGSPLYYSPTVVADLTVDSDFAAEESFGPVAPVVSFDTDEEALAIADRSPLGLVSSVWTRRMGRAIRCAEALKAGIVNINEHSNYWEIHIPFGGASGKRSGVGRLGGKHTMMEMTDLKTVTFDITRT
jgi:acyl-CoA reductase-like NAD-dependent aldehyde dehydrogenase